MSHTSLNKSESFRIPSWLPYILFAAATLFFFRSHIFGTSFFWDDFAEYVYPVRAFAAKHVSQGEIPFWNPYSFCGMPFMADVQSALFYPPNLILDLLSGSNPYPIKSLQFMIIVHFFIAQCSMYLLAKRLNISSIGSMIAAVSYGFSAPLVLHAFHPMQVEHLAWFPLIASFMYSAVSMRSALHGVIGGLLLGMTMLSGSPQMTLYMALFFGLSSLWFSIWPLVSKQCTFSQTLGAFSTGVLALAIGFGVFCVQYLPVQEIARLSERAEISFEKASVGSLEFRQIITAAVPKAFGSMSPDASNKAPFYLHERDYYLYWDTAFYCGIIAFLLGLFGAVHRWRSAEGAFFIAIGVFGFLFALGSNGFVFPMFFELPFFNALRIPARMMFFFSTSLCVLAGFGFDALSKGIKSNSSLYKLVGAAFLPTVCALGVATGSLLEIPNERMESVIHSFGQVALIFVVVSFALMFLVHRGSLKSHYVGFALLVLIFIDLSVALGDFNQSKQNPQKDSQAMFSDQLKQQLLPKPPNDIFRVSMRAPGVIALKRNQGMTDGVMLYEGYNQLLLAKRHPEVGDLKRMLDMLGVKYEISVDTLRGTAGFVQRPDYFPNAWFVYSSKAATEATVKDVMKEPVDFHNTAVVEAEVSIPLSTHPASSVEHKIECVRYEDNNSTYKVQSAEEGLLCFSEIWYPAWKCTVDGKPAKVLRSNYCLRSVEVPAGVHTVEWRFESDTFQNGMSITLATLVISVAMFVFMQIRVMKRNAATGHSSEVV